MGYDGYGNASVKNESDFVKSFDKLTHRHSRLMAEKLVSFRKELAVMVARTKKEIKFTLLQKQSRKIIFVKQ
jgi:phosphoribosylaminoimidazole carboxylase (NCAIR synthetase)